MHSHFVGDYNIYIIQQGQQLPGYKCSYKPEGLNSSLPKIFVRLF